MSNAKPPAAEAPESANSLETVEIRGKRSQLTIDDLIEHGPEYVAKMSSAELQQMRDFVHHLGVGAGSAATLTELTEVLREARTDINKGDRSAALIDKDMAEKHGIPDAAGVNMGQSADFLGVLEQMMCRTARQQIENEAYVDKETVKHGDPVDQARAARDLEEGKKLSERLDASCKAPSPAPGR